MNKVNSEGFTVVELIVSIALLGILLVAFISLFSFAYVNVVNGGNRTDATYLANTITDSLYSTSFLNEASIETFLAGKGYGSESANVSSYNNKNVNYRVTNGAVSGVTGSTVEIAVFYNELHNSMKFTVFVPYGG